MRTAIRLLAATAIATTSFAALAVNGTNDFPTLERVVYVHNCMHDTPGPAYEMMSKCSCALDALSNELTYEEYTEMSTATNAVSIGGERGGTLRDNDSLKGGIKRFKELQTKVRKGCFLPAP